MHIVRRFLRPSMLYALWLITTALGILDLFVARRLLIEVYYVLDITFWARGAVENMGVLLFAVGWIIFVYVCESVYRNAVAIGPQKLLRSFALVTVGQVAFIGLAYLIIAIIA